MVIVYCGVPGAGKSTHRQRWHPDLPVVNFDIMRHNRALSPARAIEHLFRMGLDHLLASQDFVADGAHVRPALRTHWLTLAHAHQQKAHLIVVHTPLNACLARQAGRQAPVPRNVVVRYHSQLTAQLPALHREPWDDITHVRGW